MPGLSLNDLESVYDLLAQAIDQAPEGRCELMLTKLVLLLAQEVGDRSRVEALVTSALADL